MEKKAGRPKRDYEFENLVCEIEYPIVTKVKEYCKENGILIYRFVQNALKEYYDKVTKKKGAK